MQYLDELRRLEPTDSWLAEAAKHGIDVVRVGPFCALFTPRGGMPGADSAIPITPLPAHAEIEEGLSRLSALFAQRGVALRLEFNEPLFPGLGDVLTAQGVVLEEREPLMLLRPTDFTPFQAQQVVVRFLGEADSDEDLEAYQRIFTEVLLERAWQGDAEEIGVREEIAGVGGRSHALATMDGEPVGTGFIISNAGVAEITRVATVTGVRRRGVAATVTTFMLRDRFADGDTLAWLTAQNPDAHALYSRLGFRAVGDRLYYRQPSVDAMDTAGS